MGCSARPRRIEAAIIAPAVRSDCSTSQAPRPSIADCRNSRIALVPAPKMPPRSLPCSWAVIAAWRSFCQRPKTERVIPRLCTVSASTRICSPMRSAASPVTAASIDGVRVRRWLTSAKTIRIAPPATASQPSQGWKMKMPARKMGVQGRSKSAEYGGEPIIRQTASRSRSDPTRVPARSPMTADRRRTARNTRLSNAIFSRAAARAISRPRAKSRIAIRP